MLRIGYNPYVDSNRNTSFGKGSEVPKLAAGFHFKPKDGGNSSVTKALNDVADLFESVEKHNNK